MYIQRVKGAEEKGVLRDIEKLRLDPPRKSFETDTDSDYHSLLDHTFNTDDLTSISSSATSEIRRSTDSLTPSEMEQVKVEYHAELSLEESIKALNSENLFSADEPNRTEPFADLNIQLLSSNDMSIDMTISVDSTFSTPVTSPPLPSGPPRIKPIPPKSEDDPKSYLKYLENTFSRDEIGCLLSKK